MVPKVMPNNCQPSSTMQKRRGRATCTVTSPMRKNTTPDKPATQEPWSKRPWSNDGDHKANISGQEQETT